MEAFLVANLDKNIFDLPGVTDEKPLSDSSTSYETLSETLKLLYGEDADKKREAYRTLLRMLDAKSLYNISTMTLIFLCLPKMPMLRRAPGSTVN